MFRLMVPGIHVVIRRKRLNGRRCLDTLRAPCGGRYQSKGRPIGSTYRPCAAGCLLSGLADELAVIKMEAPLQMSSGRQWDFQGCTGQVLHGDNVHLIAN